MEFWKEGVISIGITNCIVYNNKNSESTKDKVVGEGMIVKKVLDRNFLNNRGR